MPHQFYTRGIQVRSHNPIKKWGDAIYHPKVHDYCLTMIF
jgi:hypothetical protein